MMALKGTGMVFDRVIVSFHENYSSFTKYIGLLKQHTHTTVTNLDNFIIPIKEEHYQQLTLSTIANYILKQNNIES